MLLSPLEALSARSCRQGQLRQQREHLLELEKEIWEFLEQLGVLFWGPLFERILDPYSVPLPFLGLPCGSCAVRDVPNLGPRRKDGDMESLDWELWIASLGESLRP